MLALGIKQPSVKLCALYVQALFAVFNFIKRNSDDSLINIEDDGIPGPVNLSHDIAEIPPPETHKMTHVSGLHFGQTVVCSLGVLKNVF